MEENTNECLLSVQHVSMQFVKYESRVDSLKELVVRAFKRDLKTKKFVCLDDVSFDIHRGEAVAVIGRNGVGKSTLLKIVSGILKPTRGKVVTRGRISPLLRLGAGFDGNATGLENIYLNAAILGYTKKEIDAKLQDILDFAELGDFIHTAIKNYSSGMLARLGFSIAVNMESEIMLIDEILAVGDMAFSKKCNQKLAELRAKGLTFLIVSHSPGVQNICSRAIWLKQGKVFMDGPAGEVFKAYTAEMNKTSAAPAGHALPAGAKPAEKKPANAATAATATPAPAGAKPAEKKPASAATAATAATATPAPAGAKPAENKPASAATAATATPAPASAKPAGNKPASAATAATATPAENKPASAATAATAKPAESKPASATTAATAKPAPVSAKPAENKTETPARESASE